MTDVDGMIRETNERIQQVILESAERAKRLAEEGRGCRLGQETDLTREQFIEYQIRCAFWRLAVKNETEYGKKMTDDAALVEVLENCMTSVRYDEQKRQAGLIASGLKNIFGDDAAVSLIRDIAIEMGIET